ncbi:MAG TPA: uracil-DNA glycosylase [Gammaproteobacteria bacterium]|mgnify:CR=1 FL=1|nr:uracil-DNA glycosylase [Gammaproteobacteria bacterium]
MTREQQLQYLEAMGVQVWTARHAGSEAAIEGEPVTPDPPVAAASVAEIPAPVAPVPDVLDEADSAGLDWPALEARVSECTLCELHNSRTRTVFGVGNRSADWLVIGEAPGHDEDQQGEPFVGRAGQLLNAMLRAAGLQREQVFIANILKCRPPNNRDPKPDEVACCEPYLLRQIELIRPRLILAVGRIAAQNLLNTQTPIGKLRGEVHQFRDTGIPLIATYHPAYLLRSPTEKRKSWQDLQLALRTLREQGT